MEGKDSYTCTETSPNWGKPETQYEGGYTGGVNTLWFYDTRTGKRSVRCESSCSAYSNASGSINRHQVRCVAVYNYCPPVRTCFYRT
jgi:hypothetical protein